jgi:hypothetical protein
LAQAGQASLIILLGSNHRRAGALHGFLIGGDVGFIAGAHDGHIGIFGFPLGFGGGVVGFGLCQRSLEIARLQLDKQLPGGYGLIVLDANLSTVPITRVETAFRWPSTWASSVDSYDRR